MKINTILLSESSTGYEQFSYPAGESQVRFNLTQLQAVKSADITRIIARIVSDRDIIKLALLSDALQQHTPVDLVIPYLPYSRADREFTPGDCCGLRAFGALINAMGFRQVLTLDAHNAFAAKRFINGLVDVSPLPIIIRAIADFAFKMKTKDVTVLFPDEGARKRYTVPGQLACNIDHINIHVLHCSKKRDAVTGALRGFDVPELSGPALIVDDICDGGGTFAGIAAQVAHPLGLYVTHGIFSKGFGPLESFSNIYTADSICHTGLPGKVREFNAMQTILEATK